MATKFAYRVLKPDGTTTKHTAEMTIEPTYRELKAAVQPHLDGGEILHVAILKRNGHDRAADMFVDEMGVLKKLPRNEKATQFYRASWLKRHPKTDPETMPHIAGVAVVFEETVWSE
jgi:hypothetical protein